MKADSRPDAILRDSTADHVGALGEWDVRDGRPPMEIMLRLAEMPMTGVMVKEGSHGFPDDATRKLLGIEKSDDS